MKSASLWLLAGLFAAALCAGPALADNNGERPAAVRLLTTIPVPGEALRGFDISWVDAQTQRYYLADRSNKAIDVIDAMNGTFLKQITGGFKGVVYNAAGGADNAKSGPDGVLAAGRWLFVGDAPSRLVSIDLNTGSIADTFFTANSPNRANEIAYDPVGGVLLITNSNDEPPFFTLIDVNQSTGKLTLRAKTVLDAAHGVDATNGTEQPLWEPTTGKFYLSIPELSGPGDGSGPNGAIARIDPLSGAVEALYPVQFCQPGGLVVGPRRSLLIGCSAIFDTAGNEWSAADANAAAPTSVIMDARNGSIDETVAGVSGSDEVWFNPGDVRYYLAARNQPGGPVLGVIDAQSQALVQVVPTLNVAGKPSVFPAATAHSVAANPHNNHVFVPLGANNVLPNCLNGCIAVFGTPQDEEND